MGYGYLVVCTTTQCVCYPMNRVGSPVQFDLKDAVITLKLAAKVFLLADCNQGIQIYTYEGRLVSVLRLQAALRPEIMASDLLAISPDTVAIRNPADQKEILFFDSNTGKPFDDATITHNLEIVSVHLSQPGAMHDRKVAFVDRNSDLHFGPAHTKAELAKLSAMVSSVSWHDQHETIVAVADGRLTTWYYPSILFSDCDLLPKTKEIRDGINDFTTNDRITNFFDTRVQIRRGEDGALLTVPVSPYPVIIFRLVEANDWDGATRLTRFLGDELLWAVLTGLALQKSELNIAEIGYGALSDLAKVRYVRAIKEIPIPEGRQAELALLQNHVAEAERVYSSQDSFTDA
ncbi:hypothetical protein AGDE_07815 [Angomonas deanei]|nr:hypothetical protein AGDE_07815 [Angomonas deanei]|eukprot:EPY34821.1 hypothetical protein AGDE_07815 [Angomonas deanei]